MMRRRNRRFRISANAEGRDHAIEQTASLPIAPTKPAEPIFAMIGT